MFEDLSSRLEGAFQKLRGRGVLTEDNVREGLREVRRALLEADVNHAVAKEFVKRVQEKAAGEEVLRGLNPGQQVVKVVHDELVGLLGGRRAPLNRNSEGTTIVMMVGLQGSGKTTTCGKLARRFVKDGKRVLLVAADVYRPAARDQLRVVGEALGVETFTLETNDPVAICRAGAEAADHRGFDAVILDTAGRLHIDDELMRELERIQAGVTPHETLLVLDGMTGQDAVNVASTFAERLDVTGAVLTKMDGDARGGAALSLRHVTGVPLKFVGVGEKSDALEEFHPDRMASRILGMGDVVSLVEKAQEAIDEKDALRMAEKLRRDEFTFEDFLEQMAQLKKMGPLEDLLKMIPGMGKQLKGVQVDEKQMARTQAIIQSMTRQERLRPTVINGSRRKRIAKGSGTSVQDVNRLLKQFRETQKLMKRMRRSKGRFRMPLGF